VGWIQNVCLSKKRRYALSISTVTTIPTITLPDQFNAATAFLDRHLAEGRGAKTALYYEGATYSYAQITELANSIGNGLLDLGVEMEQRVALILFDSPQFATCFLERSK
jgi:acyl-coenzyme A synthetase/AMP-(fatty) acid ligase